MRQLILIVFVLPFMIASLLITIDAVLRSLDKLISSRALKVVLTCFLYFIYLYFVLSFSYQLVGFNCYEYSLSIFIAYFFLPKYGKYLILITPFFILGYYYLVGSTIGSSHMQIILLGVIQFLVFILMDKLFPVGRYAKIITLLMIEMFLHSGINILSIDSGLIKVDKSYLVFLGSVMILILFQEFFSFQEKESHRVETTLLESQRDALTGAYNFAAFSRLSNFLEETGIEVFSIAMLDFDHFKALNDRYGHVVGNDVLKKFIELLREDLSRQLEVNKFRIYRFGGEEFCVVFFNVPKAESYRYINQFREKIANNPIKIKTDLSIQMTFSAGIETSYYTTEGVLETLQKADEALYQAKEQGRNIVIEYKK